jgi:predicted transglutaminase-like cysteine proteinase
MLLSDLLIGTTWEDHLKKASLYQAIGLSLTVSRYKNHLSLKRARKTLVDFLHEGPSMFTDGRLVLDGQLKIQAQARAGSKALKRLEQWEELINSRQGQSDWQKLTAVNDFFNHQITVALDENTAKGYDYWQSPVETLARGKGDCDDFAVAKYFSLQLLGISSQQLRIGIVEHATLGGHAVLFFYPLHESDPWVLDNLTSERLGSDLGRIRRLSSRVLFNEMKPLWGMTENILTEFHKDLSETVTDNNPREVFPAFAIALANSQRLLPQDENPTLVHASLSAKH